VPNRNTVLKYFLACLLTVLPVFAATPVLGKESAGSRVIMVIVNRITYEDLNGPELANINKLMAAGGVGVMNINTAGDLIDTNAYSTIGAGNKALGSNIGGFTFNVDELVDGTPAGQIYRRNTGFVPGDSRLVNYSVAALLKSNENANYVIVPGALGEAIRSQGGRTAVIGNSDGLKDAPERWAALIGMDARGRIDEGDVGTGMLKPNPLAPFGWETDYVKLEILLKKLLAKADFIVVETGDTARVDAYADQALVMVNEGQRARALKQVDAFIGRISPLVDKETMVMLVTPLPPAKAVKRDGIKLAPVIMAGGGIKPGSILTTPTTRQPGLLGNYDLAPTVLAHLGLKQPKTFIGLPVSGQEAVDQQGTLQQVYAGLLSASAVRPAMLRYFAKYQVVVLGLVLLSMFVKTLRNSKAVRIFMLSLYMLPLALLLQPLFGSWKLLTLVLLTFILTVLLTLPLLMIKNTVRRLFVIAVVVALPIVIDVVFGAGLMKRAVLSYDLVVGGRFYGIGNEYMGVLIGTTILGAVSWLEVHRQYCRLQLTVIGLIFTGLIFFFAAPNVGTNAGGALAAVVGYAFTMYLLIWKKLNWRAVVIPVVAVAAGVGILVFVNSILVSGTQSHIGRAVRVLTTGDFQAIWLTVVRKALANWYLFLHSPWSSGLIMLAVTLIVLKVRFGGCISALFVRYPDLHKGYWGMLAGATAALVFNDSGIISAALMGLYLVLPLTEIVFDELREET
jgi:hypothetical protein